MRNGGHILTGCTYAKLTPSPGEQNPAFMFGLKVEIRGHKEVHRPSDENSFFPASYNLLLFKDFYVVIFYALVP